MLDSDSNYLIIFWCSWQWYILLSFHDHIKCFIPPPNYQLYLKKLVASIFFFSILNPNNTLVYKIQVPGLNKVAILRVFLELIHIFSQLLGGHIPFGQTIRLHCFPMWLKTQVTKCMNLFIILWLYPLF